MSTALDEKSASIERGLEFIRNNRPLRAEELARDYLAEHPGCVDHIRLLATALMRQKRSAEAEEQLRFALTMRPEFPQLHEDLGSALALQSRFQEAIPEFEKAIQLQPALPFARRKLAQALAAVGRREEAEQEIESYIADDPERAEIARAIDLQREEKHEQAIELLRELLRRDPGSVNAMRYLAVSLWRGPKNLEDAEALLRQATQLAPDYTGAWMALGGLLMEMNKYPAAITVYQKVTKLEPRNAQAWASLGGAFGRSMYPEKALQAYEKAVAIDDKSPHVLASYAWELKTVGDQAGALETYRRAIRARPEFGPAYWSMANLKIFKFEDSEVETMLEQVERDDLTAIEDIHFRFAIGKAMEDRKDYDRAWHFYHTGNQRQRAAVEHDPLRFEKRLTAVKDVFTKEFLARRAGAGFEAPDPIFIVGLPRSGSTLVEQILASHSQVEGTAELPILGRIRDSIGRYRMDGVSYPEAVRELRDRDLCGYGKQFIDEAARYRSTDRPFFTDKLPNNFAMLGFARLILPNARFINARRHPYDCCLGNYKQLFGQGQNFTYDMLDLAHYYQQYHAIMKHWHEAMPGQVLDVHYEDTVTDLETQVRRILGHCGLPFEEQCLRYYETDRAVKTASSEQVRQPIYTSALGKWRRYDRHIGLWKEQLGAIVDELPDVVRNAGG